ncbi:hypothetical protein ACFL09_06505 [Planctomycetota bacterium]
MARRLPADLAPIVGETVKKGQYHVLEYCGSGKRGYVFRARSQYGGERALKFIPEDKRKAGWEAEALKAHRLEQQPHTVRFHEIFFHDGYTVLVFDFVAGATLRMACYS